MRFWFIHSGEVSIREQIVTQVTLGCQAHASLREGFISIPIRLAEHIGSSNQRDG